MTIFVNLMYSGGIPFLLIVCGADLFLTYWTDKIFCTRFVIPEIAATDSLSMYNCSVASCQAPAGVRSPYDSSRVASSAVGDHCASVLRCAVLRRKKGTPITIGLSQSIIALIRAHTLSTSPSCLFSSCRRRAICHLGRAGSVVHCLSNAPHYSQFVLSVLPWVRCAKPIYLMALLTFSSTVRKWKMMEHITSLSTLPFARSARRAPRPTRHRSRTTPSS